MVSSAAVLSNVKLKSGAGSAFASTAGALSGVEKLKSRLGGSTAATSLIVDSGAAVVSAGLGVKSNVKSSGLTSSAGLALGSAVIAGASVFASAAVESSEKLKSSAAGSVLASGSAAFSTTGAAAGLKFNDEVSNSKAASGSAVLFEVSSYCNWSKEAV